MDCFGTYFTHAQSCDNVRVPSATEWTASVHTLHMPKAVITFVFQVLLGTCSIFAFSLFRVSAFSRFPVFAFSRFRVFVFSCFRVWFSRFRVFAFCRRHPRGRATHFVCTVSDGGPVNLLNQPMGSISHLHRSTTHRSQRFCVVTTAPCSLACEPSCLPCPFWRVSNSGVGCCSF